VQSDFWDFELGSRRNVTIPDEFSGVSKFFFKNSGSNRSALSAKKNSTAFSMSLYDATVASLVA